MKNLIFGSLAAVTVSLTAAGAYADSTATTDTDVVADAAVNSTTEGGFGLGGLGGGANPCAEGFTLGVPGVGGFGVTGSNERCIILHEAQTMARLCSATGKLNASCIHLARNNKEIRNSLIAAGRIKQPAKKVAVSKVKTVKSDAYVGGKMSYVGKQTQQAAPEKLKYRVTYKFDEGVNLRDDSDKNTLHKLRDAKFAAWEACEPVILGPVGNTSNLIKPGCSAS